MPSFFVVIDVILHLEEAKDCRKEALQYDMFHCSMVEQFAPRRNAISVQWKLDKREPKRTVNPPT
jgi:hypothetical protein